LPKYRFIQDGSTKWSLIIEVHNQILRFHWLLLFRVFLCRIDGTNPIPNQTKFKYEKHHE
jgi:hypothetical protein